VIFDDGSVIGPAEMGLVANFKAAVDAKQDLMEEISARLANGESLHQILASMPVNPDKALHALDPNSIYKMYRRDYLDELVTTERNFGEEAAKRSLAYHKYSIRPNIHKAENTEK
jgi:hypothetical protein